MIYGKHYWKVPFAPLWCPTLRSWAIITWGRWIKYGGLRLYGLTRRGA